MIKDDKVWDKSDEIWDVFKDKLGIKFHSKPAYEYRYLKAKVIEFDGVIKTKFWVNDVPKENMHYTCIACITSDSVMNFDEKNHLQVYLEKYKYRPKKIKMCRFINTELKSDWVSDSDSLDLESEKIGVKIDNELMTKLEKSGSDSE